MQWHVTRPSQRALKTTRHHGTDSGWRHRVHVARSLDAMEVDRGPATHLVRVLVDKPERRRGKKRIYVGLCFPTPENWPRHACGVPIRNSFYDMPSFGRLVAGDEIRTVGGEPIASSSDLVFHWDRAAPGPVAFEVLRTETHRLHVSGTALQSIGVSWNECMGMPVVAAVDASDEQLRRLPAFLEAGDLVLSIGGSPTGMLSDAKLALERAASFGSAVEISVRRHWPAPLIGVEPSCCWERIPVPKARRVKSVKGREIGGAVLADLAPKLIEGEGDEAQTVDV